MGHRLDQVVISLVGDETPHIEDDLLPGILITYSLNLIREPWIRIYTDRKEGRLILSLTQEGGLLYIHGRRPQDQIRTTNQPALQWGEEAKEELLLEDITMPM